jgi:hypothetical protein
LTLVILPYDRTGKQINTIYQNAAIAAFVVVFDFGDFAFVIQCHDRAVIFADLQLYFHAFAIEDSSLSGSWMYSIGLRI